MPNDYDFPNIKNFKKKVGLPSLNKWRVSSDDAVVSGKVLTMIKHKGFLYDGQSSVKLRETTVTKQGYMIIYASDEKGYVVDIPEAIRVNTCTTTLRAKDLGGSTTLLKRTQIEIKFRFGSVMLSVMGQDAIPWIEAINRLANPSGKESRQRENSCQLETVPMLKRPSQAYSIISDNSVNISLASPLPLRQAREKKGFLLKPIPLKKAISPIMGKKMIEAAKIDKKEEKEKKKKDCQKKTEKSEDKRRNTVDHGKGEVNPLQRKASAPSTVSEEKIDKIHLA